MLPLTTNQSRAPPHPQPEKVDIMTLPPTDPDHIDPTIAEETKSESPPASLSNPDQSQLHVVSPAECAQTRPVSADDHFQPAVGPPDKYGVGRPEFQAHIEDEEKLERRQRRRRRIKRHLRKCISGLIGFCLGVASSYVATIIWLRWPAIPPAQSDAPSEGYGTTEGSGKVHGVDPCHEKDDPSLWASLPKGQSEK